MRRDDADDDDNGQQHHPDPDNPKPPPADETGKIGESPTQDAELRKDIELAKAEGATDIRVNQEQVNAQRKRVGINRPDLQYTTKDGTRVYIEYDTKQSGRGLPTLKAKSF